MKRLVFILALIIPLTAGIIFTGYRSSTQKQKAAPTKVPYANTIAQNPVNTEEWIIFKSESEIKIREHEIRIAELKTKNQGEISDAIYMRKVANLEQQNKFMKAMLVNFEKGPSNWESFNRGFNHDMGSIEKALKDLTVDNKK